jgi:predicted transcriptional regulator
VDKEAWIVSVDVKGTVNENETVTATVTVVRGDDMLDYVWTGTLVLEVVDLGSTLTLSEEVELATGGETRDMTFDLVLSEPGDHQINVTLFRQDGTDVDAEGAWITVVAVLQDPGDGAPGPTVPPGRDLPDVPATAVAAAGILVIFGALAATEVGKLSLLGLLVPLYSKLKKDDILDHFTRGKIYGYILANPGDHYSSIQRALGIPNGTFAYHLHVLEKEGYIRSARFGTNRCFFPAEMRIPPQGSTLKASQRLIIERIVEEPGISQKDIADSLGVSSSTVNYHITGLLKLGVVETERKGMRLKYYINREMNPSPS